MRKLLFVCSLVLGFAAVQPANAQFLKKMGKALGSALSASSTSSSSSSSSSSAIPRTKFVATACEYWGENVLIRFVVTNTSSESIDFEIGRVEAIDDKGRSHEVSVESTKANLICFICLFSFYNFYCLFHSYFILFQS